MIDKQKVRELANRLIWYNDMENTERLITEWLEQNQPSPVVEDLTIELVETIYARKLGCSEDTCEMVERVIKKFLPIVPQSPAVQGGDVRNFGVAPL